MITKRKFDKELKIECVKMILSEQRTVKQIADKLEVSRQVVHRWVKEYREYGEAAFIGIGHQRPETEVEKLRRENARLKREIEVLNFLKAYSTKKHL